MEDKKMMVNVYQNRENGKKEIVNTWEDEKNVILQLTAFLYRKAILKSSNIRVKYNYHYDDMQTITFVESYTNYDESITRTYYEFLNIPTNLGYLDIYKINDKIGGNK